MTSLMPHLKSMPKALAALTGIFTACGLLLLILGLLPSTWRIGDGILDLTTGALMLLLAAGFYQALSLARYAIPLALAGNTIYLAIRPWPNEGPHQWHGPFLLAIVSCWYFLWKKPVLDYFSRRPGAEHGAPQNGGPAELLGNSDACGGPPSVSRTFAESMKALLCFWAILLALPCAASAVEGFSITVTNTTVANQRRYVKFDIHVSKGVSITKGTTLLVVVGSTKASGPADEFGPPQNFVLKGTSHEIGRSHFRVAVALPLEKVSVKFMLVEKKGVLYEQTREL